MKTYLGLIAILFLAIPTCSATLEQVRTAMDSILKINRDPWMSLNQGRTDTVNAVLDVRFGIDQKGKVAGLRVDSCANMPASFRDTVLAQIRATRFAPGRSEYAIFTYSMFYTYQGQPRQTFVYNATDSGQRDVNWLPLIGVVVGLLVSSLVLALLN